MKKNFCLTFLILLLKFYFNKKKKRNKHHIYIMDVEYFDYDKKKTLTSKLEASVGEYFDANGTLVTKKYYKDLAKTFNSLSETKKSK
jgi:hypothetical protein